jgi:DNA recombination-mediator protein A
VTIRSVRRGDADYPPLLAQIPDPPSRVWVRGDAPLDVLSRTAVAIVGARACSGYGRSVARLFATESAAAGAVVVSGMARGIDGEAHRGALAAAGTTVAVLGCGVDRDYPAAHAELARSIVESGGLVVSEYEPGVEPAPWRFLAALGDEPGIVAVAGFHPDGIGDDPSTCADSHWRPSPSTRRLRRASRRTTRSYDDAALPLGDYTVAFEEFSAGGDFAPLFRGPPEHRCQSSHWGIVLKGRLTVTYADGQDVVEAGEAYSCRPATPRPPTRARRRSSSPPPPSRSRRWRL